MNKMELMEKAKELGLEVNEEMTKAEIEALIDEKEEELAAALDSQEDDPDSGDSSESEETEDESEEEEAEEQFEDELLDYLELEEGDTICFTSPLEGGGLAVVTQKHRYRISSDGDVEMRR